MLNNKQFYRSLAEEKNNFWNDLRHEIFTPGDEFQKCIEITNTIKLENKLFKNYLNNFNFLASNGSEDVKFLVKCAYSDVKLEEFSSKLTGFEVKSQWHNTKYASYLEEYSKSFEFIQKTQNYYKDLMNQIDKPSNANVKKSVEKIIYENNLKKYQKLVNADQEVFKRFDSQTSNLMDVQRVDVSLNDLALELAKSHTSEGKMGLLKMYLNLLLKKIELKDCHKEKMKISFDYYKLAEASFRVFPDEKILVKKICKDFEKILKILKLDKAGSFEENFLKYQLEDAQFALHREHFGRPDKRVDDFIPDAWQIKLMDVIDSKKSCIVVAPTSSGKTFASFYAFEKILTEKDNTMVIYVAPAKALINQMLAAIYSKYKRIDPGKGNRLIGVFTRDQVENVTNCRILLTVPECLEIIFSLVMHINKYLST